MAMVIFLRGVNVGSARCFRPSALASALKQYDVVNIGAAGTLVARKRTTRSRLRKELRRHLPFETEVMICSGEELLDAVSNSPFQAASPRTDIVHFVSVLGNSPKVTPPAPVVIPSKGEWSVKVLRVHGPFLFGIYRREMKAISCLGQLDKLFGAPATTRNWNTICAILKVLG